jgi:plastocyanin
LIPFWRCSHLGLIVLIGLYLTGCGSSSSHDQTPALSTRRNVVIQGNQRSTNPDAFYVPDAIQVRAGQTITWTNRDTDPHDVTAVDGSFYSGPIADGATYRLTLTQPGTYQYFCTLHPEMLGVIVVRPH